MYDFIYLLHPRYIPPHHFTFVLILASILCMLFISRLLIILSLSLPTMHRAKSLIISESAFCNVAISSVTDQEEHHHASGRAGDLPRRFSSFNLSSESDDNEAIIAVAKKFLTAACPELLTVLENHYDEGSARDRLIKIGRNINATLRK